MEDKCHRIGEIIEAETQGFNAQTYELYDLPEFGSLLKCQQDGFIVYAVTSYATTASLEPGRQPIARGRNETDEAGILKSNPQLTHLLKSTFSGRVIGFQFEGKIFQFLPPKPTKIHSFVYLCNRHDILSFSESLDFLMLLTHTRSEIPFEELVAASLRNMSAAYDKPEDFLLRAGAILAELLNTDYTRLKNILSRIKL